MGNNNLDKTKSCIVDEDLMLLYHVFWKAVRCRGGKVSHILNVFVCIKKSRGLE